MCTSKMMMNDQTTLNPHAIRVHIYVNTQLNEEGGVVLPF